MIDVLELGCELSLLTGDPSCRCESMWVTEQWLRSGSQHVHWIQGSPGPQVHNWQLAEPSCWLLDLGGKSYHSGEPSGSL